MYVSTQDETLCYLGGASKRLNANAGPSTPLKYASLRMTAFIEVFEGTCAIAFERCNLRSRLAL
jgi:hypothetical protein